MKKNSDLHPSMPSLSSTVVYSTHPNPQHHPISPSSTANVSPLQDTRALGHIALPPRLTTPPIPPRHPPPPSQQPRANQLTRGDFGRRGRPTTSWQIGARGAGILNLHLCKYLTSENNQNKCLNIFSTRKKISSIRAIKVSRVKTWLIFPIFPLEVQCHHFNCLCLLSVTFHCSSQPAMV